MAAELSAKVHDFLFGGGQMLYIDWCKDPAEIDQIAAFFARNVTRSYISHSELQFGRAIAPDKWFPNLETVLKAEIEERVPFASGTPIGSLRRASMAF